MKYYIMDLQHNVIEAESVLRWMNWFLWAGNENRLIIDRTLITETKTRMVGEGQVTMPEITSEITTLFIGHEDRLFITMIDCSIEKTYKTWAEAAIGHGKIVEKLKK